MKKIMTEVEDMLAKAAFSEIEGPETLTDEAIGTYGVMAAGVIAASRAEAEELQAVKSAVKGHGEQTVFPDDCQFGDNDLCFVEA